MQRREMIRIGAAGSGALVARMLGYGPSPQREAHVATERPAAIARDEGDLVYVGRDPVRIKLSPRGEPGRFGMITQEVSVGTSIPVHLHENEDELIFIQSGQGEATIGDDVVKIHPGSTLYVPRGTWHGGRNTGGGVLNWIAIYSPSGFEGYFREIGRRTPDEAPRMLPPEEREARDRKYGIRYRR